MAIKTALGHQSRWINKALFYPVADRDETDMLRDRIKVVASIRTTSEYWRCFATLIIALVTQPVYIEFASQN
jgi:hypothetical protein